MYSIYSQPQYGSGLPVYAGARRQSGGGILGSIARFALPILKNVGKRALGVAAKTVKDVATGKRGVGEALKRHGKRELLDITNLNKPPPKKRRRKRINKKKKPDVFDNGR